jgi:hypothetical protein
MRNGLILPVILSLGLLFTLVIAVDLPPAKGRMPLWDRIALSDCKLYTSEGLDEPSQPTIAKKGTWAKLLQHSDSFTSDYVELEAGGKYWIQEHAMLPLYYVVGTDNLVVQLPGTGTPPNTMRLARPGDTVAVDHTSPAPQGKVLVWSLDGSLSGLAPVYQLEPVGDPGEENE